MRPNFRNPLMQWGVLLLLALVWGSSFILMKRGLEHFGSTEVAAFRMGLASLVLLPVAWGNLNLLRGNFWPLLIAGAFGNAIPAFLFAYAQTMIPSSLSGMLNALTSLWTVVFGALLFQTSTRFHQLAGILIALAGALGLVGFGHLIDLADYALGALIVVLATAMYGLAVNTIKSRLHHVPHAALTALSFMLTGPWLLIYLFVGTDFSATIQFHPESLEGVAYLMILAVVGTSLAVMLFNRLIKETSAVFASSVTYLIPVVALGWGLLDGEDAGPDKLLFLAMVLGGVFLVNSKRDN